MRPVNYTAPVVPFKHSAELHLVPSLERRNPGSEIYIVSDQQGLPGRQTQYESLMPTPVIVIRKHLCDGSATLHQHSTFAICNCARQDGVGGDKQGGYGRNQGCSCGRNWDVVDDPEVSRGQSSGNEYQLFHVPRIQAWPQSDHSNTGRRARNDYGFTEFPGVRRILRGISKHFDGPRGVARLVIMNPQHIGLLNYIINKRFSPLLFSLGVRASDLIKANSMRGLVLILPRDRVNILYAVLTSKGRAACLNQAHTNPLQQPNGRQVPAIRDSKYPFSPGLLENKVERFPDCGGGDTTPLRLATQRKANLRMLPIIGE